MAAAYRESDLVLNTSTSEGISNVLAEAMMCGRAILASDIPGNRDILEHGVTAALYKNANDLTDLAAWLIRDPAARAKLGAAAQAYARDHFSIERETDALLAAYDRARRA
jgi:glycosyltransferase involved in cell wall biosynthesis